MLVMPVKATDVLDHDLRWRSVLFSAAQLNGSVSRLRTSSNREPPLARCSGTRLDQAEIRDERAVLRDVFDAADEIGEGRVQLLDDRRRLVRSEWLTRTLTS